MTDALNSALSLAKRGIPVFPCQQENKKPHTAHGFKDRVVEAMA